MHLAPRILWRLTSLARWSVALGDAMEQSHLCRRCSAELAPRSRYCSNCGQPVDAEGPDKERRQLTIVFCDVVGYTPLSQRLDPEDLADLLRTYQAVCRQAIAEQEGHLAQFQGDGVLSYFGYPTTHEDDAVRAIRAALGIIAGLKQVNQGIGKGAELKVRIGIHTGLAMVGGIGPGGAHDRLAFGEAVNVAARIQSLAEPDTVLVSEATARLIEGLFELRALKSRELKGFPRPVDVFEVVRPTGLRTKFEATSLVRLTPYVGRHSELRVLTDAWREVQAGASRVVVVRGEAGIGKSRLLHHFRYALLGDGAPVSKCFCSPLSQATAFAPIVELLNSLAIERAGDDPSVEARREGLRSLLLEHPRLGSDALPLISMLLSIPTPDEPAVREWSPARRRARTVEILRDWIASSAEHSPLVMIFEDAHWADPSSEEFLDSLIRTPPSARTLLCITARPELEARWTRDTVRTIELTRLQLPEIETMVTHVAGGLSLPPFVLGRIAERSEGVPLFIEEITKAVLEAGSLHASGGRYELIGTFDERSLPATVHGSLLARFDRLGDSRAVAQAGAAIGRDFSYSLVRAVTRLADDELRRHLDVLVRSELAFAHGEPPTAVYTFKHALIQDAIYGTMPKSEQARIHQRIFTALEEGFRDVIADRPEMAAYHAERAGQKQAAVPLLRDAGMKALGRTAVAEAVKHLAHGIELAQFLDEPMRSDLEVELQAAIGPAYMSTVGWASREVEQSSLRLRDLAAAKADGQRLYQAMWGLWTVQFLRGELDAALDVAREVHRIAQSTGDPMLKVTGHHALGYTHFYRGEYKDAILHADDGLALFDIERERHIAAIFQLSSSCALWCFRAQSYQMLAQPEEALRSVRECEHLDTLLGHLPTRVYLLCLCYYGRFAGDVAETKARASVLRSLSLTEGLSFWGTVADIFSAWTDAEKGGDARLAAEQIRNARRWIHAGFTHLVDPEQAGMEAEVLLRAGDAVGASRTAQEAAEIVSIGKQRHAEPDLFRLQGDAAAAAGQTESAISLYRQGIERARSLGAKLLELRCEQALADLSDHDRRHKVSAA